MKKLLSIIFLLSMTVPANAGMQGAYTQPSSDITYATGTLPITSGGTGQSSSLFSPETYKKSTDSDDTLSLQTAISSAQAVGGHVVLEGKRYFISSCLHDVVGSTPTSVEISGLAPAYTGSDFTPFTYPYLTGGTVIEQDSPATDVFCFSNPMSVLNMHDFGMTFGESIIFSNTGHGINFTPPPLNGVYAQGMVNSKWSNLYTFGHDGNHYAYNFYNAIYDSYDNLWSYGGGIMSFGNFTNHANYLDGLQAEQNGNIVGGHIFGDLFIAGSANCYNFYANQSQDSASYSNFYTFDRLQCNKSSFGIINGHTITPPSASQVFMSGSVPGLSIQGVDFEPASQLTNTPASATAGGWSYSLGSASYGINLNGQNFGQNIQPYEAGMDNVYGQRRHFTDLSTRISTLESAGSSFPIIQDSALSGLTYSTDGTRILNAPSAGIHYPAASSGNRWTVYVPPIGTTFFDTTLGKLVTYNGSTWVDGAGTALDPPAASASSANDAFARSAVLQNSYSNSGQQWAEYTGNGSTCFQTNGTYAYCNSANWYDSNRAWIFTNNYNGKVSVNLVAVGNQPQVIFRLSDRNNYWLMTKTEVKKYVNGVGQDPSSGSCSFSSLTNGAVPTVVLSGSSITVKNGATTLCTITDSFNSTSSGYGIGVYGDSDSHFESFSVLNP